jgi:hypothetical protein
LHVHLNLPVEKRQRKSSRRSEWKVSWRTEDREQRRGGGVF